MINILELDSGARLVYEKLEYTQICSVGFWFLNGSVDENPGEKGYAHFIEHILFKGTKNRTTSQIALAFDRIGSNFNAFTEKEVTCFYCTFPAIHLDYVLDIFSDILFSPLFEKSEIKKEKSVIISEIQEYEELPEENSYDIFLEKMWQPHSIGYKITGETSDIKKIKKEALADYYCNRYTTDRLIISVAGSFDEKVLLSLLEKKIPERRKKPDFDHTRPIAVPNLDSSLINNNSKQVYIHSGIAFPSPVDMNDYYTLLFFSTLTGEAMSSRLFQKLREEEGLCYSIYSFRTVLSQWSMWNIYANTSIDILDIFFEKLQSEFDNISANSFTASEIENARTHLEGNLILSQEDIELRMKRMARHYIFSGRTYDQEESNRLIKNVSSEKVHDFISRNFSGKILNILIYGNTDKIRAKEYTLTI